MPKLNVLVVEDNAMHVANVEMLLEELGYAIAGVANTPAEALELFSSSKADLVLMDIDLGSERDGIDIAARINAERRVPVIFTTSFTDDATFKRAKATDPYAYMIKPLAKQELQYNIELAIHNTLKEQQTASANTSNFNGWKENIIANDALFVKTQERLERINLSDILWVEVAFDRYCQIQTANRAYTLRTPLKSLETKLTPFGFVRIHRAYIANLQKIDSLDDKKMLINIGKHELPLGTVYKQMIMEKLTIL